MKYDYAVSINQFEPNRPAWRRPVVKVKLFGPKGETNCLALVDSGADYCMFNVSFVDIIGIDLNSCERGRTIGVEGGSKEIYITELEIEVEHLKKIKIPVNFIDSSSVGGLLGQIGFFDKNRIKFERDHNTFEISPVFK